MRRLNLCAALLFGTTLFFGTGSTPAAQSGPAGLTTLRVGVDRSFFHDMSPRLIQLVTEPIATVLRDSTGLKGEAVTGGDPFAVAQQLSDNQLQLAVFHGFEFAWVRQKHADLRPLMLALKEKPVRAYVLVRDDSNLASIADLKGKDLAIPRRTREHCRYHLERQCRAAGASSAKDFFRQIVSGDNIESTLDQLGSKKVHAALVDQAGLHFYKDLKPGVFARFKVLSESEVFPPDIVAYRQGSLDEKTLGKIRDGLRLAEKSDAGREILRTWSVSAFEPVPQDFPQMMETSNKNFPPP